MWSTRVGCQTKMESDTAAVSDRSAWPPLCLRHAWPPPFLQRPVLRVANKNHSSPRVVLTRIGLSSPWARPHHRIRSDIHVL